MYTFILLKYSCYIMVWHFFKLILMLYANEIEKMLNLLRY